jgi:hypothetical protein
MESRLEHGSHSSRPSAERLKQMFYCIYKMRLLVSGLGLCLFMLIAVCGAVKAQPPDAKRLALLIGISDYDLGTNQEDGFRHLNTGADLENMSYALKTFYGFKDSDIHTLLNERATQANIVAEFRQYIIKNAGKGSVVVIYYTGHGHQVIDTSGDEKTDGLDEALVTWVPADKQSAPIKERHALMYMLDDTYQALLAELAQKMRGEDGKVHGSITVIFDSCHSGSATKGLPLVPKGRDWNEKIDGPLPHVTAGSEVASGWLSHKEGEFDGMTFIAGSQSGQLSYMMPDSEKNGSLLTYYLTEFLANVAREKTDRRITYDDLYKWVGSKVSSMRANQDPQIEGNINSPLLCDCDPIIRPALPSVRRVLPGSQQLELSEGSLHGVTVGSRFDIYRNAQNIKDPANKLAEIIITETMSTSSIGNITKTVTPAPKASAYEAAQAVATEYRFEGQPLKVLIQTPLPLDKKRTLTSALEGQAFLTSSGVTDGNFDVRLGWCQDNQGSSCKDNKGKYVYQRAGGSVIALGPQVDTASLQKRLLADWRWRRLANLTLPGPAKVRIDMVDKDGAPLKRTEGGRIVLKPGDEVQVLCTNNTGSPMFISLIYLKASGEIEIYPTPDMANGQQALNTGNEPTHLFDMTDFTAPRGPEVEVLKIIATPRPTDFSGMSFKEEQRRERPKGPKNPLEEALFGLVDANAKDGHIRPAEVDKWYTDQVIYEIQPPGGRHE